MHLHLLRAEIMARAIFVALLAASLSTVIKGHRITDGWLPYRDELYIKAFTDLLPYEDAVEFCAAQGDATSKASLVMVKESRLQDLLVHYTRDIVDYVWLGAQYDARTSRFKWQDGKQLSFTNWLEGYPRTITDGDACIEMRPLDINRASDAKGKWAHVTCRKRNLVICQKRIPWTLENAVNELIRVRKQQEQETSYVRKWIEYAEIKLGRNEKQLQDVSTKVVPIGFIYVEFYNQPDPAKLWPSLSWQDVTSMYAGLFFRALGTGSDTWGNIQAECAPRITHMDFHLTTNGSYPYLQHLPYNGWSEYGQAGEIWYEEGTTRYHEGLRFYTKYCDVRPKNVAIRIWKRVA